MRPPLIVAQATIALIAAAPQCLLLCKLQLQRQTYSRVSSRGWRVCSAGLDNFFIVLLLHLFCMPEKIVYAGKYITVKEEPKGKFIYERAYMRPSVQVIPFTKDGKVLLIRENRDIEGKSRWKFVSGFMDKPGLTEEQVAQEELMEEAGYAAGRLLKYFILRTGILSLFQSLIFSRMT